MKRQSIAGFMVLASICEVATACRRSEPRAVESSPATAASPSVLAPPRGDGLEAVTLPDFAAMSPAVRAQMQSRYAALKTAIDRGTSGAELGSAYGEMGKLLMAATQFEAAEACYQNARRLAPVDRRWAYYLGHLYKVKGPLEKSVTAFEQALTLAPDDVATMVWLGDAYLAQGRADIAAPLFAKALAKEPKSAAAMFGAGRVALVEKRNAQAVEQLEGALALEPRATAIHYPLAMAYRGLGNVERAQEHLDKQGDLEARPADPLMRELDELLESAEAFNVRGGRELDAGNWAAAAGLFQRGLELNPDDTSLRHRLGTALSQMGDVPGATEQFERVLRASPEHARAHFSLGVLLNANGQFQAAVERFTSALKYEPGYVQARVQLAGALARSGRPGEAVEQYARALEAAPTLAEAAFGQAMAFVRMRNYQEARDRLAAGMATYGGQPAQSLFSHALARLLAAAPDDHLRDGKQAKRLADELYRRGQSLELAETVAMTLAELGDYQQAVAIQRDLLNAAEQAGRREVLPRLENNLRLYERRQPCRVPFTEEELP